MTITTYTPLVVQGDGVTTVRTVNWKPISLSFIKVEKEEIATGTRTVLTSPADYTAALLTNGTFTITISPALSSDYNLLVYLDAPFTQGEPFRTAFGWDGKVIEDSLDKLTILAQQVNDSASRSLRLAIGSTASAILPAPSANDVIGWNTAADALVNYTPNTGAYLAADVDYLAYTAARAKWFGSWVGVTGGATTNLGAASSYKINLLGTSTITSFGSSATNGDVVIVRYDGVNTLTHSANIILKNGGANRVTAAGAMQILTYKGFGVWEEVSWLPATPPTILTQTKGTFTPALTFSTPGNLSVTYSTQSGDYTRIGDFVHCDINIVTSAFTHTTASGNALITGLPFTISNSNAPYGAVLWGGINKASYTNVALAGLSNTTQANLVASGMGQAAANVTAADMPTGGTVLIRASLDYRI